MNWNPVSKTPESYRPFLIKRKELYKIISKSLGIKQYHTGWTRTIEECREVYKIGLKIKKEVK